MERSAWLEALILVAARLCPKGIAAASVALNWRCKLSVAQPVLAYHQGLPALKASARRRHHGLPLRAKGAASGGPPD